jgi:hypothetical protein
MLSSHYRREDAEPSSINVLRLVLSGVANESGFWLSQRCVLSVHKVCTLLWGHEKPNEAHHASKRRCSDDI